MNFLKKSLPVLILLLLSGSSAWSQATAMANTTAGGAQTGVLHTALNFLLLGAGALISLAALVYLVKVNQFLYKQVITLEALKNGVVLPESTPAIEPAGEPFWTRMRKKYWEDAVPVEREGEITLNHAYDGIRELDNRLPPWWVNMFILTIFWAGGYMYFYHWGGKGQSQAEAYTADMAAAKKAMAASLASKANAIDESSVTVLTDDRALGEGALIFKNACAACHGQLGEGTVGPNMTDEYWLHGGGIRNVFKTIKYGVPEKGMIAWQAQLRPADIQKVASYILTLQGTNPPNAKTPQGEVWKDESEPQQPAGQEVGMR